jgi:hypothetical protein
MEKLAKTFILLLIPFVEMDMNAHMLVISTGMPSNGSQRI